MASAVASSTVALVLIVEMLDATVLTFAMLVLTVAILLFAAATVFMFA